MRLLPNVNRSRTEACHGHAQSAVLSPVHTILWSALTNGRFAPSQQDRDLWELRATKLDEERWAELAERSTTPNATPADPASPADENEKSPNPLELDDFENSRGGTRTRDPGIMRETPPPSKGDSTE